MKLIGVREYFSAMGLASWIVDALVAGIDTDEIDVFAEAIELDDSKKQLLVDVLEELIK